MVDAKLDIDLKKIIRFWEYHTNSRACFADAININYVIKAMPNESFRLALDYFMEGHQQAANNLVLNGAFLLVASRHCSLDAAMENISSRLEWLLEGATSDGRSRDELYRMTAKAFPVLDQAYGVLNKPNEMARYLSKMCNRFPVISNKVHHVITDSLRSKVKYEQPKARDIITITVLCGSMSNMIRELKPVEISIGKYQQLKKMFNEYAEVTNASLRALRFSHDGRILFPSSEGNKTPDELGIGHKSIIKVTNLANGKKEGTNDDVLTETSNSRKPSSKTRSKVTQRKKRKKKMPRQLQQPEAAEKTVEELKIEHSKIMGKLHDEMQPQLKLIRQQLNNLVLERMKPKGKSTRPTKYVSTVPQPKVHASSMEGVCGQSRYVVHVGEPSNLYKTHKLHSIVQHKQKHKLYIDLHGMTQADAMKALDDSLPRWNDIAMASNYPFVVPVDIICGSGTQALSEVVDQWIKCHDQVSKAPNRIK